MNRKIVAINSFEDFLSKFDFFLFCDRIRPSYDLLVSNGYYYSYGDDYSEKQLTEDILNNKELFVWKETRNFYYPNDNMFSGNNSMRNIKGYEASQKKN